MGARHGRKLDADREEGGHGGFRQSSEAFVRFARALAADSADAFANLCRKTRVRSRNARMHMQELAVTDSDDSAISTSAPSARRRLFVWFLGIGAAGLACLLIVLVWALHDVPWQEIAEGTRDPVIVLEAADGEPIVQEGPYRGAYADYDDFPGTLIAAVTTIEDRRFFEHNGLDLWGIGRALVRNVLAGEVVQGGSTITQQLVKISYLERERTFRRKIQEAVIALWLDWKLDKEEILTRYLNSIYLGEGATGVPAAARVYFGKEVKDLTLAESAMIAGLIRAPSILNPVNDAEAARRRTEVVLDAMAANGVISPQAAEEAELDFAEVEPTKLTGTAGSWFADWVLEEARKIAGPYNGTIRVRTTLVPSLQRMAQDAVNRTLEDYGGGEVPQAALVAMTPQGAVVAMVGGKSYKESQFNRAVSALRQPGSTFKLFVYYAALKAGTPLRARVDDSPVDIDGWKPENFDGRYHGWVSFPDAFARSLNVAAVKIAMEVGIDKVIAAARELGIDAPLDDTPSLALGTSEVTLLDLTGAYASVRNGMAPVEPYGIASFSAGAEGGSIRAEKGGKPAIPLGAAQRDLTRLLELAVERGTGREADFGGFAAGKTGTSQDHRDAWFIGFSDNLVAGVWVGRDDNSPMEDISGSSLPATIWRRFMEAASSEPLPDVLAAEGGGGAQVSCNIQACERAYRSFRASDCTFQPYDGPRRLCEK